jgi:hypothetical protein
VHDYDLQAMRMVVDDRTARRAHEASAERLAREIRGTARQRTKKVLRAAWSRLAGRLWPDHLPRHARAPW